MKRIIVWFRNDLRIHDHPALAQAVQDADEVLPLFICNDALLKGDRASSNRNRFLLESLQDLQQSLMRTGANLIVRQGDAVSVLRELGHTYGVDGIYYTADYTPYAIARDKAVHQALDADYTVRSFGGRLAVSSLQNLRTKSGSPHKVFTPFWKQWMNVTRRQVAATPRTINFPSDIAVGQLPNLTDITKPAQLSVNALHGGETAARTRLQSFIENQIATYQQSSNDLANDATSRLSSYLHFGCISPVEIETMLPDNEGAQAWHRQLCWREFYHYVLLHNPHPEQEFQERYRSLPWGHDTRLLEAWQTGQTGYPVVDAGMRQLRQEGWMHNRARLIVGSFLTKDLWQDWRAGEKFFMQWLIDGDMANNNGNWQWIASVGVDPAPVYRRLYNPTLQQINFDPTGAYVRRYVPELAQVPDKYLAEPWNMPPELQQQSNCVIGKDYPAPIVDHKIARKTALDHYRSV